MLLDLIDDDTVEDTEYYFLNISSALPKRVSIARYAAAKITIIDDDGKLHTYCFYYIFALVGLRKQVLSAHLALKMYNSVCENAIGMHI